MDLLPAIVLLCLSSFVQTLQLNGVESLPHEPENPLGPELARPGFAGYLPSGERRRRTAISAAQLGPLAAMQQLSSLHLQDVDSLGSCLAGTLRHLTALTSLRLRQLLDGDGACSVFDAAAAMVQLQEMYVSGAVDMRSRLTRTEVLRLPDAMSRLVRLRRLETTFVRLMQPNHVLTALTALQQLKILD